MGEYRTRTLWVAWVLANTVSISAFGAGVAFATCPGSLIGAALLFAVVASGGGMLGAGQYAALRLGHVPQAEVWFVATASGWWVGIVTLLVAIDYRILTSFPPEPLGTAVWVALMAAAQCWPLVRLTRHAGLWVPVSSVAAALAMVAGGMVAMIVDPLVLAGICGPANIKSSPHADALGLTSAALSGAITGAMVGLVFAAITAAALVWLLRYPVGDWRPKFGARVILPIVLTLGALVAIGATSSVGAFSTKMIHQ